MHNMAQFWLKHRDRLDFVMITQMFLGKFLLALGIGVLLAEWMRGWGWWLVGTGILMDGLAKWRWLRRK